MTITRNILIVILIFPIIAFATNKIGATKSPVYMKADHVVYDADMDLITAKGNIHIVMDDYTLYSDKIYYEIEKDSLIAIGNIQIIDSGNRIIRGDKAVFTDKLKTGVIEEFILKLEDDSILVSRLANRLDKNKAFLYKSAFTPCKTQCGKNPIWQINAEDTYIDFDEQRIRYKNLFFEIYGIPVIFLPYFSHPTPNAPAKSGILVPKIRNNDLVQPIYFRVKDNLDLTISPRFGTKYTITEFEARHLLPEGQYKIEGSYGNPPYVTNSDNHQAKYSKPSRYHMFTEGLFYQDNIQYGFEVKKASDKAYLKNYYDTYTSYLASRVFINKIEDTDYFSVEGIYFQELRSEDKEKSPPIIFPNIKTLNVINLNDDQTTFITIRGHNLTYNDNSEMQFIRSNLDIEATQKIQSNTGHLFSFTISNRFDLYLISALDNKDKEQEKVWYRNIPEIGSKWSFPMIQTLTKDVDIKIEPIASVVLGEKYNKRYEKFGIIDAQNYELGNDNIFDANRFSGIDFHEYGNRINYGLNSSILSNSLYIDAFLGQAIYKHNTIEKDNAEYVGSLSVNFDNWFEIFYRFRKSKVLKPIRDEIGMVNYFNKIQTSINYVALNNISRYYSDNEFKIPLNKSKQIQFEADYQISDNLTFGGDIRFDITNIAKYKTINKTIRMTYTKDCVSMSIKLFDDYTTDKTRGLKKVHGKTFSIGLKVLNM
jgi:LPS-assembly protein